MKYILAKNKAEWDVLQTVLLEQKGFSWICTGDRPDDFTADMPIMGVNATLIISKWEEGEEVDNLLSFLEGINYVYGLESEEKDEDTQDFPDMQFFLDVNAQKKCICTKENVDFPDHGLFLSYPEYEIFVEQIEKFKDANLL